MHEAYFFKMRLERSSTLKDAVTEFEAVYAAGECDDNNWSRPMALVLEHDVVLLPAPSQVVSRSLLDSGSDPDECPQKCVEDVIQPIPAEEADLDAELEVVKWLLQGPQRPWRRTRRAALNAVVDECSLLETPQTRKSAYNQLPPGFGDKSVRDARRGLVRLLARALRDRCAPLLKANVMTFDTSYPTFGRLGEALDQLHNSDGVFTTLTSSPYRCRAFDLTEHGPRDGMLGILIMDIHT